MTITPDYTITDLERLANLPRRTIHFYVKEGVIPPPDGTGGGAKYSEHHLLRLKLIRHLQKSHLKLSGVREALDAMSLEEMRTLVDEAPAEPLAPLDSAAFERWASGGLSPQGKPADASQSGKPGKPLSYSFLEMALGRAGRSPLSTRRGAEPLSPAEPAPLRPIPPRSGWERLTLTEGLELHIRTDVADRLRSVVSAIERICRRF